MMQQQFDLGAQLDDGDAHDRRKKQTRALLRVVQNQDQDFEWYPTCEEQIEAIRADLQIMREKAGYYGDEIKLSCLDVGAGDGRLLMKLTQGERFAIEKSIPLIQEMDKSIAVIGTDFHQSTLVDKKVDVVTCNPPYSEYEMWCQKIITEANCALAYLIIPSRWVTHQPILDALAARKADYTILGSFDYSAADRVARAHVDVVRIELGSLGHRYGTSYTHVDPFDLFFNQAFPLNAPESEVSQWVRKKEQEEAIEKFIRESTAGTGGDIVKREGLVRILEGLYQRDLAELMNTYTAMSNIPGNLLRELDVNISNVKATLKLKIKSLKDIYWNRLFSALDCITDKLTSDSRKAFLERITSRTNVDFTEQNAIAIVIWCLKVANQYFDKQFISVFETMTEAANVVRYKSNQRTIRDDRWRYCRSDIHLLGEYALDYRIVLERVGGIDTSQWSSENNCGLRQRAADLINDLVTIAYNIGFDSKSNVGATLKRWVSGKAQSFYFHNHATGKTEVLFEAKAFKNGNIHLKLNPKFIQKLNCVHGRLKGWLKCAQDAVYEMDVPVDIAEESFHVPLSISVKQIPMLARLDVQ